MKILLVSYNSHVFLHLKSTAFNGHNVQYVSPKSISRHILSTKFDVVIIDIVHQECFFPDKYLTKFLENESVIIGVMPSNDVMHRRYFRYFKYNFITSFPISSDDIQKIVHETVKSNKVVINDENIRDILASEEHGEYYQQMILAYFINLFDYEKYKEIIELSEGVSLGGDEEFMIVHALSLYKEGQLNESLDLIDNYYKKFRIPKHPKREIVKILSGHDHTIEEVKAKLVKFKAALVETSAGCILLKIFNLDFESEYSSFLRKSSQFFTSAFYKRINLIDNVNQDNLGVEKMIADAEDVLVNRNFSALDFIDDSSAFYIVLLALVSEDIVALNHIHEAMKHVKMNFFYRASLNYFIDDFMNNFNENQQAVSQVDKLIFMSKSYIDKATYHKELVKAYSSLNYKTQHLAIKEAFYHLGRLSDGDYDDQATKISAFFNDGGINEAYKELPFPKPSTHK